MLILETYSFKVFDVIYALDQGWTNATCTWQSSGAQGWSTEKGFITVVMQKKHMETLKQAQTGLRLLQQEA